MRDNLLIKLGVLGVVMFFAWSCAPKKRLTSSETAEREVSRSERREVINEVEQHRLVFTTFSGRAKGRLVINKDDYDITANVRIRRDSAIWISVTTLMNIEAGRLLITPDSIKLINRLKSEYVAISFDQIHRFMDSQLDFYDLQELLVGNPLQRAGQDGTLISISEESYVLRKEGADFNYTVHLNAGFRSAHVEMENNQQQRIDARYGKYQGDVGRLFPFQVGILVNADGLAIRSEMNFTRATFDDHLEMPFNIPSTYREIH